MKNNEEVQSSLPVDPNDNVEKAHTDVHCAKELAPVEEHLQCAETAKNPHSLGNSEAVTKTNTLVPEDKLPELSDENNPSEFDSAD